MNNTNTLTLSWSISRGRDTYGYNICRLDSYISGKRYRCSGGGYDMVGTVLGNFFEAEHQDKLIQLVAGLTLTEAGYSVPGYKKSVDFYGLTVNPSGRVTLDGGCGESCIIRIIEACGFNVQYMRNRKGQRTGYLIG